MLSLLLAAAKPSIKVPVSNVPTPGPIQVPQTLNYTPAGTWFQQHAGWLTHTLGALFVIFALGLIVLLAVQTTKQEGLSGTIGGRVESAYGRPGTEEQLKRITGVVAVAFVVVGTILSLTGI